MKINKAIFAAAVQLVSNAAAHKASMPELGMVRMTCDGPGSSCMTLTCSDLDRAITETVSVVEAEPMDICANAAQLATLADELDGEVLRLELVNSRSGLKITGDRPNGWFRVPISSPSNAICPLDSVEHGAEIDLQKLCKAILSVSPACGNPERGVLANVLLKFDGAACDVVATDGAHLHISKIQSSGIKNEILLAKPMQRLLELLSDREGPARISFSKGEGGGVTEIFIQHQTTVMKLRNSSAVGFPNYPKLFSTLTGHQGVPISGDILAALNRLWIVEDNVKVTIDGNACNLASVGVNLIEDEGGLDAASEAVEVKNEIGIKYSSNFKTGLLVDAFRAAGENPTLYVASESAPCVVRGADGLFQAIIMPMRNRK